MSALMTYVPEPGARITLARALLQQGQWQRAASLLETVIAEQPKQHAAFHSLGDVFKKQKLWQEAKRMYLKTAELVPDTWQCWHSLIEVMCEQTLSRSDAEHERDEACQAAVLRLLPRYVRVHQAAASLIDVTLSAAERAEPYRLLCELFLQYAQRNNISESLKSQCLELALQIADSWLALQPNAVAYASKALCLYILNRFVESLPYWEAALEQAPTRGQWRAYYALAMTHLRTQEARLLARKQHEQAIEHEPGLHTAMGNLSFSCASLGDLKGARFWVRRALEVQPENPWHQFKQACFDLQEGKFQQGFTGYEARLRMYGAHSPKYQHIFKFRDSGVKMWQGEDLRGLRIFVQPEQGYGDFIMMARFLPLLLNKNPQSVQFFSYVVMDSYIAALPLPERVKGVREVIFSDLDFYVPIMSLPHFLGVRGVNDIPPPMGPIINDAHLALWRTRLPVCDVRRVGVSWRGNEQHEVNEWRSIDLTEFAKGVILPLQNQGYTVVSVQKDVTQTELLALQSWGVDVRCITQSQDWLDSAALVRSLDGLVAVDTALIHLSGSLGVPAVMLNRHEALSDWRWMLRRTDSPWYPSLRIAWQQMAGEWASVMQNGLQLLHSMISVQTK